MRNSVCNSVCLKSDLWSLTIGVSPSFVSFHKYSCKQGFISMSVFTCAHGHLCTVRDLHFMPKLLNPSY